jgi:uncharacterized membrane protein
MDDRSKKWRRISLNLYAGILFLSVIAWNVAPYFIADENEQVSLLILHFFMAGAVIFGWVGRGLVALDEYETWGDSTESEPKGS